MMQTENSPQQNNAPWYRLIPVILYAALPMLVPESLFPNAENWAVFIPALLALAALIADAFRKRLRIRGALEYAPLACYALIFTVSFIFCTAKDTAVLGSYVDASGFFIRLSLVFMLFYTINTLSSARGVRTVLGGFSAAVFAMAALDAGRMLKLWDAEAIPEDARLLFICMLIPVASSLFIREDQSLLKRRMIKLPLLLTVFAALCAQLFLTDIAAGIPAAAAAVAVTVLFFTRRLRPWSRALLILWAVAAVLLTATSKTWPSDIKFAGQRIASKVSRITAAETSPCVNYIHIEEDNVSVSFGQSGKKLNAEIAADSEGRISSVSFTDEKDMPLTVEPSGSAEKEYIFNKEPYKSTFKLCIIKNHNDYYFQISTAEKAWRFKAAGSSVSFAGTGFPSSWFLLVAPAALLLIFIIRCVKQLFWRDLEKYPAGMEAAAALKGITAMLAALTVCSLSTQPLPAFFVLLGTGTAALDINERFSTHERSTQNDI